LSLNKITYGKVAHKIETVGDNLYRYWTKVNHYLAVKNTKELRAVV